MRLDDYQFRRLRAATATGEGAYLFISEDKNFFQIRRELLTKQFRKVMAELKPEVRFHADKPSGVISANWKPLIRITPVQDDKPKLEFGEANLVGVGVPSGEIEPRIQRFLGSAGASSSTGSVAPQWSL